MNKLTINTDREAFKLQLNNIDLLLSGCEINALGQTATLSFCGAGLGLVSGENKIDVGDVESNKVQCITDNLCLNGSFEIDGEEVGCIGLGVVLTPGNMAEITAVICNIDIDIKHDSKRLSIIDCKLEENTFETNRFRLYAGDSGVQYEELD